MSCEFVEGSMPTVMNIHNFCKIIYIAFLTNPCCNSAHQRWLSISTTVLLTSLGSDYPCNSIGRVDRKKKKKLFLILLFQKGKEERKNAPNSLFLDRSHIVRLRTGGCKVHLLCCLSSLGKRIWWCHLVQK